MKSIDVKLIEFITNFISENWKKINKDPVCFGLRDDSYGSFTITESGLINTFKLVHRSGSLKCRNKASASYWGFAQVEDKLITLITFKNRTALLLAEYGRYTQGCNYYSYPILTAWMSTRQNLRSTIFLLQCLWRRLGKSSKFGLQETWSTAVRTVTILSQVAHVLMFMHGMLEFRSSARRRPLENLPVIQCHTHN